MRRIYFDHNATSPMDPAVSAAMMPYFSTVFGNPSSVHSFGQSARAAIERARQSVALLIGAQPSEIVFTGGGTEADNNAILGLFPAFSNHPTGHVITTTIEHAAVLQACAMLERRGISVTYVPVEHDGTVDPSRVRMALRSDTRLISVMHANNELGTVQPIEEIGRIAFEAGVRLHCDAVQSAGKLPIDVRRMGVDLLSLSAHKFCGPQGVGALFIRKGLVIEPLLHGGHAERERRAGTENVAGIVGLGHAADLARARLTTDAQRISKLRHCLEQGLLARVTGVTVNGAGAERVPNTSNLIFSGVHGESLIIALDLQGLACSAGAACASGTVNPSHVLTAIGLSPDAARSSVRFSLGSSTTEDEIALALELISTGVCRQRSLQMNSREMAAAR